MGREGSQGPSTEMCSCVSADAQCAHLGAQKWRFTDGLQQRFTDDGVDLEGRAAEHGRAEHVEEERVISCLIAPTSASSVRSFSASPSSPALKSPPSTSSATVAMTEEQVGWR